jgi:hypothetical protein
MSFPPATEMFQFTGFASRTYGFSAGYPPKLPWPGGLPHSETPGSPIARISPGLFAACHVLHRLSVPRHPPDALHLFDPRRRCGPPVRGKPQPASRKTAAHSGKPQTGARPGQAPKPFPARRTPSGRRPQARRPQRRVSHEDTSSDGPARRLAPAPRNPSASVTFTNSLHPVNQHPPRTAAPVREPPRPAAPDPERNQFFSECRFKRHGFGRHGFGRHGFGRHGFGRHGFGRHGFKRHGFKRHGFKRHGFGRHNFGRHGSGIRKPILGSLIADEWR